MASIVAAQKKELLQSGGTYNGPVTPTFTVSTVKTWTRARSDCAGVQRPRGRP